MSSALTSSSPSAPPASGSTPPSVPPAPDARARLRQELRDSATQRHVQAAHSILFFIAVDALLLLGYAPMGALSAKVGLCFFAAGAAIIGGYRLAIHRGLHLAGAGVPVAIAITAVMSAMLLGTAHAAPQVGVLMLMTLVTMIAMTALSLPSRYTLVLCALLGAASATLLHVHGPAFSLPTQTVGEQLLSGAWFVLVLVRGAMLNLKGIELRRALAVKSDELADALQRLEELATHDELTGLLNRRAAMELLKQTAADKPFSVAIFDIDEFKQVNDTLGHAVGDTVLKAFAAAMQAAVRDTDRFARYGGEEFLLVMPGQHDPHGALQVADRLRTMAQTHPWDGIDDSLSVTVSAGVATLGPGESIEQALGRADNALYAAKRAGRNRVHAA